MKKEKLVKQAKRLVDITISQHDRKLLGKDKISIFFENNLSSKFNRKDYNSIIHLFCKLLAREGFEIINDVDHFDIINYRSYNEYRRYCDEFYKGPKNKKNLG